MRAVEVSCLNTTFASNVDFTAVKCNSKFYVAKMILFVCFTVRFCHWFALWRRDMYISELLKIVVCLDSIIMKHFHECRFCLLKLSLVSWIFFMSIAVWKVGESWTLKVSIKFKTTIFEPRKHKYSRSAQTYWFISSPTKAQGANWDFLYRVGVETCIILLCGGVKNQSMLWFVCKTSFKVSDQS